MSDPRVEAVAKALLANNPFNDEEGPWEVPSIKDHYTSMAIMVLSVADALDPRRQAAA